MSQYQLDGYAALEGVRRDLAAFLRGTFRFAKPELDAAVHDVIWRTGLLAPRVVEPTFPYEEPAQAPRSMADLAATGDVHPELVGLLASAEGDAKWPATRSLYTHQIEAIKAYRAGKSTVVSSGTGSGKTECFLLPAIDNLLRDEDLTRAGIRVLLVYPLNALVNNQMDRLRAIIGHHPKIRFALYTRRLAETEKIAERKFRASGKRRFPAEIISREALRAHPPHIVVTNFSMLEYALVRPADSPLFAPRIQRPRMCILDEAHVYAGSMATELTLLLRRAWLRWGLDEPPQGIVTSATMLQGIDDGPEKLLRFATDLLSKRDGEVVAIGGRRVLPPDEGPTIDAQPPVATQLAGLSVDFPTLKDTVDEIGAPRLAFDVGEKARAGANAVLAILGRDRRDAPSSDLWHALEPLSWVRELRRSLHEARAERLDLLAERLFPEDPATVREHAVLNVLGVLAVARREPSGLPLLPVRLHAVVRGPYGVHACINGECPGSVWHGRLGALYPDRVVRCACGGTTLELRVCEGCGQSLLGATEGPDDDGLPALLPTGASVALFVPGTNWDDGSPIEGGESVSVYANGRIASDGEGTAWTRFDGGRVRGLTKQLVDVACPKCEAKMPSGAVLRRIEPGTDAAPQIIVDALYPSLPKHPNPGALRLPGEGRRALLFADNRQVAAALAAKIEESHDIVLARTLLWRALDAAQRDAKAPEYLRLEELFQHALRDQRDNDAQRLMEQMKLEARKPASGSVSYKRLRDTLAQQPDLRELSTSRPGEEDDLAAMVITRELGRRPARRGNLEAVGAIAVVYEQVIAEASHPDVVAAFASHEWTSLVETVLDVLRTSGLVTPPILYGPARRQIQLNFLGRTLVKTTQANVGDEEIGDESDSKRISLIPSSVTRTTRLFEYVSKVLARRSAAKTVTPLLVLEQVWDTLCIAARAQHGLLAQADEGLTLPIGGLRFRTAASCDQWRCGTCKTVWAREVSLACPTSGCNGTMTAFPRGALDERERLVAQIRMDGPILGLRTEEHTAQIGVDRLEEREQDFKAGRVNVLTSSTTMELGIDIGGLSATVLTNVPPGASNYLQRAGRAGRRAEGTSLVLTYARPRPFDQAAFADPLRPFRDRIVPPIVRLDTERIVRRHLNAFLLAYFFRTYEAQGDVQGDPMSALRTARDFFFRPVVDVLSGHPRARDLGELAGGVGATLSDAYVSWLSNVALGDGGVRGAVSDLTRGTILQTDDLPILVTASAAQLARITANAREQRAFLQERLEVERKVPETKRDIGAITALELQQGDLDSAKLLGYLAEEQYLPRYGFPVQVVSLDHRYERSAKEKRPVEEDDSELRLSRDISLAISEYAPGADIVAAKEVHRSAGLLRHWTGSDAPGILSSRVVAVCLTCGRLQYGRTDGEIRRPCPTCLEGEPRGIRVLEPRQGFGVQWGTHPKRWIGGSRPPLRPVTETAYAARDGEFLVEVSPGLTLGYDPEGQILVRAEGQLDPTDLPGAGTPQAGNPRAGYGYAICYLCGRAEPETRGTDGGPTLPRALRGHRRLRGDARCEAKTEFWRNTVLAGAMRTETLSFQLRGPLQLQPGAQGTRWATTWMVALQLSAGEVLGIDSRSFGSILVPRSTPSGFVHDALLYDQMAGGAGLCRALLDRWKELLDAARRRLTCPNPLCQHGCHRCLIAFETQRYEEAMRRTELVNFLDSHWEELTREPVRSGVKVSALVRGRFELLESLRRAPNATVSVFTPSISADALDEGGWLNDLLMHCDRGGRVRLVVETLPDSEQVTQRFLAKRLGVAIESGRCEVRLGKEGSIAQFPWQLVVSNPLQVLCFDNAVDAGLGPSWLSDGAGIFRAVDEDVRLELASCGGSTADRAKLVPASEFDLPLPPPGVLWQHVPPLEPPTRASFAYWLRGPDKEPLFARPLAELHLVNPYLASDWQLTLLQELCSLARGAGCASIRVDTYAPDSGKYSSVRPEDQRARIRSATNNQAWNPLSFPQRSSDRLHKRLLRGTRSDGTKFEVLFERGIDFIVDRGRSGRTTRETFIIVRDPA